MIRPRSDLPHEVVDLTLGRADLDLRVDQAGGSHDLLDHRGRHPELVGTGGGRHVDELVHPLLELVEAQRAVVDGGREPEPEIHQRGLARDIPLVHAVQLGNRHVGFVEDHQVVVGEIVEQGERRGARPPPVDVS